GKNLPHESKNFRGDSIANQAKIRQPFGPPPRIGHKFSENIFPPVIIFWTRYPASLARHTSSHHSGFQSSTEAKQLAS
ncbi:hypothetical protein KC865_05010, partial [Candidatus Kaiserbacteria bacterium]|nr:hypothetical protein [Candidatus Kaiserbacteria bacterium]